jgi:hypothetical protein
MTSDPADVDWFEALPATCLRDLKIRLLTWAALTIALVAELDAEGDANTAAEARVIASMCRQLASRL